MGQRIAPKIWLYSQLCYSRPHTVTLVAVNLNNRTPALEGVLSSPQNYGFDAIQEMMSQTPQGKRLAEPEEIAYAVGMLCEEKARFINGIHVHVSGGLYID